jgi:hypothetical protein
LLSFSMSDPVLLLPFVATITVYHTIRSARLLRVCRGLLWWSPLLNLNSMSYAYV